MYRYKAVIRLPNGVMQDIFVQADNDWNARQMFQDMYGLNNIMFGPVRAD